MVVPVSDIVLPSPEKSTQEDVDEMYDAELDICMTAERFHELNLVEAKESSPSSFGKEILQKEKRILVDPISLRRESSVSSSRRGTASFNNLMLPRLITGPPGGCTPPLTPPKTQFISSCSLPNSASSSPRFSFGLIKKKWKNESNASPRQIDKMAHRHSAAASHTVEQEILWRSRSCAEGRSCAPADELELLFSKPITTTTSDYHQEKINIHQNKFDSFGKDDGNKSSFTTTVRGARENNRNDEEGFKCGALCLYIPGFGSKGKPVGVSKKGATVSLGAGAEMANNNYNLISRTVSLEKFECGSWASSAAITNECEQEHEDGEQCSCMNHHRLYFDLPLELIRSGVDDAVSPVAAAFLFDKDLKGVLKKGTLLSSRKSHSQSQSQSQSHEYGGGGRHVRFSISSSSSPAVASSPAANYSCITPRLRKAREDFNAFLEAQSARS